MHEITEKFAGLFVESLDVFEARKKGYCLRAIMMALAEAFPEDKQALFERFGSATERKPKERPQMKRVANDEPVFVQNEEASRTVGGDGGDGGGSVGGCKDCPGGAGEVNHHEAKGFFDSIEDILARFEGSVSAMIAFCQSAGIKTGKANTPEKLADVIYKYYNAQV